MKEKIIAKRYAEAFLSSIKSSLGPAEAAGEFKDLKIILRDNPDLEKSLQTPEIAYSDKCRIVDSVLRDFSEEVRDFLKLLLLKGRIKNIIEICDYIRVNYTHGEVVEAVLKAAHPLDSKLIQKVKEALENKFKKKFNLNLELDASLLGGIQVTAGSIVMDGSLRRRLGDLKEKLMAARIN